MTGTVRADQRNHSRLRPCPVCGGGFELPSGSGQRCYGFAGNDPGYAVCTRLESPHPAGQSSGFTHYLRGRCDCGETHGSTPPPVRFAVRDTSPEPHRLRVDALASAKGLPTNELLAFGLKDTPSGVEIAYPALPDGTAARSRLRTALRAADGTIWLGPPDTPITLYSRLGHVAPVNHDGRLIAVEGESDCWTGWHYNLPAIGFPCNLSSLPDLDTPPPRLSE